MTFDETAGKTLLVVHDLYPSKEALDSGSTGAIPEALDQLDELLASLGSSTETKMTQPIHQTKASGRGSAVRKTAFLLMPVVMTAVSAQQKPTTRYAPVNGIKMNYEVHGSGDPVVLLHGAFMTITNNWTGWIDELSKTRKVIAIEMQGHGRTADIPRDITYEDLADDVAALLDHLKIPRADLIGYSMGGAVAMQCAIRHPDTVRKVVVISSRFRHDGFVKEGLDAIAKLTADTFKGSPIEAEYKKLSPTPDEFPNFIKRVVAMASKPFDLGADKLEATEAPMFFIHGDADGVRLAHVASMYRLKGGEIHGDMQPRSASRLAILPDTTHVTLMQRIPIIVPMVNDFLAPSPSHATARWRTPARVSPLGGVVEYFTHNPYDALLRLDTPRPGIAALGAVTHPGGQGVVAMNLYLYGDEVAAGAAHEKPLWDAWFQEHLLGATALP